MDGLLEGGQPQNLTPLRPSSPAWIEWAGDEHIYVSEVAGGDSQLVRFRLRGDRTSEGVATSFGAPIFSIPGSMGDGRLEMSLSATADHKLFVFHASSFDRPVEVYAAKPGDVARATRVYRHHATDASERRSAASLGQIRITELE